MNSNPHKTRLHSLANLASLLYDTEESIQEASVMKESNGGKEVNLQTSIIVRNQPASTNNPYDQTSAQTLK